MAGAVSVRGPDGPVTAAGSAAVAGVGVDAAVAVDGIGVTSRDAGTGGMPARAAKAARAGGSAATWAGGIVGGSEGERDAGATDARAGAGIDLGAGWREDERGSPDAGATDAGAGTDTGIGVDIGGPGCACVSSISASSMGMSTSDCVGGRGGGATRATCGGGGNRRARRR